MSTPKVPVLTTCTNRKPLNETQSSLLIWDVLSDGGKQDATDYLTKMENESGVADSFIYKILEARLGSLGLECSFAMKCIISMESDTPAVAVMWVNTLNAFKDEYNGQFNYQFFGDKFPFGFPSDEEYAAIWETQKTYSHAFKYEGIGDNLFDIPNEIDYEV